MKTKIFADGADLKTMIELVGNPRIAGLTTNPSLLKKAGVTDYKEFAQRALSYITDKPISFEVIADDFLTMKSQALEIASWGSNVNVKIPITNTKGEYSDDLIEDLSRQKVKVNVTAIMTNEQVRIARDALGPNCEPSYISVFAGRIADTGIDPIYTMQKAKWDITTLPIELIWASPRELLNIFQADMINCDIITVTPDILKKLSMVGYDLNQLSLDTVRMFYNDALAASFSI